jgi:alkyl hydroperoxide reductase subunit AhpC
MTKQLRFGFVVDPQQRQALMEIAAKEGRSISDVLRRLVDARIARSSKRQSTDRREARA